MYNIGDLHQVDKNGDTASSTLSKRPQFITPSQHQIIPILKGVLVIFSVQNSIHLQQRLQHPETDQDKFC